MAKNCYHFYRNTTFATTMDPHLTDEQADLLLAELDRIIDGDRYPLSARIRALCEIRALLKPYPERPPRAAPQKAYEPPAAGRPSWH